MNPLFLAGAATTKHAFLRFFSVACVAAVLWFAWFAVDRLLLNPTDKQTTHQEAQVLKNIEYTITPKPMLGGCVRIQVIQEKDKQ